MYINFEYIKQKGILPEDVIKLQLLHQSRVEDLSRFTNTLSLSETFKVEYTTTLKNGELRLSQKGKDLLDNLQIPNLTDDDVKIAAYLINRYKEEDKIICSKNKACKLIAWFRSEVNLTSEELFKLIQHYLNSLDGEYNKKLEYLFFKPENAYEKLNLNSSRLYLYLEKIKSEKLENVQ